MNVEDGWEEVREVRARSLFVGGAPPLSGETALAVVELLWAMADAVDGEYAAEIESHRSRLMSRTRCRLPDEPWRFENVETQLTLDLGDDESY